MRAPTRFIAGAVLVLAGGAAFAVGLGNIQVTSGLNEPFAATIPVMGASEEQLINMTARLAQPETFERAGIPRPYLLNRLKFEVVDDGNGNGHIEISSRERIKEPTLEFIIDVEWGKGQLRRAYSVLMDPR